MGPFGREEKGSAGGEWVGADPLQRDPLAEGRCGSSQSYSCVYSSPLPSKLLVPSEGSFQVPGVGPFPALED